MTHERGATELSGVLRRTGDWSRWSHRAAALRRLRAPTDARFVLVILRGALDGLAAAPAYGDGDYASKRGELAITAPQHKLDGLFALHPFADQTA